MRIDLQIIQSKIYEIRGQRVMLDRDLSEIYGVEIWVLNSKTAIYVNMNIMRVFVRMREYLLLQSGSQGMAELRQQIKELQENMESLEKEHEGYEQHFDDIYLALAQLAAKNKEQGGRERRRIGFVKPGED